MVPDKFNMVDMGGIDLIMMQGEEVPGLYNRLVESIAQCRYQCLYNWLFDGVIIPPTYVEMEVGLDEEVRINEGIVVTSDDVIHIYSIEPPAEIIPLLAEENGVYNVPVGKDGFNPVTVDVPSYTPVINSISITENGTYTAPSGVDGYSPVTVNVPAAGDYELLEYIDSNGTQGIDLGFKIPASSGVRIVFAVLSGSVAYNWIFGCEYSANSFTGLQITSISGQNAYTKLWSGSTTGTERASFPLATMDAIRTLTVGSESQSNVWAFALGRRSGEGYSSMSHSRIYFLGISDRNFYPCRRKADNVCGLWDEYNQQFLTDSLGGDPFAAGPLIFS